MKYIITESRFYNIVSKFFSHHVNLDNVKVLWGSYYRDNEYVPNTRFIKFVLDDASQDKRDWSDEDENIVFIGGNEHNEWLYVSNPPTSLDDTPSKEDIARYNVCVFDDSMADEFDDVFGKGSWEEPLMHYINNKLGTNFSSFLIEMI